MRNSFTLDLALKNLRRNRCSYLPYALSCIGVVTIFFIIVTLANTTTLHGIYGGRTIQRTLQLSIWVMVLFSVVFLFYTHSFLICQRKKELGLFNILGLEKRHIARVLLVESFLLGVVTTGVGMALGVLLSRLMYLAQLRMLGALQSPALSIHPSTWAITAVTFLSIHALTVLNTLRQVHLARPVELLRAGSMGERVPKANWWLALLGAALLAWGYGISLSVKDAMSSIPHFLKAVVLVILATYALFTAGTVAATTLMQKNKDFYYRPNRFTVVAGMRHRMRRHAVGLASICILSTMVLVMMSFTISLFASREDMLRDRFPKDALFSAEPINTPEDADAMEALVRVAARQAGVPMENMQRYRSSDYFVHYNQKDAAFATQLPGTGIEMSSLRLVPETDYAAATGLKASLQAGQVYAHSSNGETLPENITVGDVPLTIVESITDLGAVGTHKLSLSGGNYTLIMHEEDLRAVSQSLQGTEEQRAVGYRTANARQLNLAFDTGPIGPEKAAELLDATRTAARAFLEIKNEYTGWGHSIQHIEIDRADFNGLFGGLLFVSIYLGLVFIMAMVLIIYYKQVSEGHEDKGRFAIMQQVGMSAGEVRRSIRAQVLMVFFLPLAMAGLHLLASFNITAKVMTLAGLLNLKLFAWVTLGTYLVFAVFYMLVYWKTAGSYYRIVKAADAR